MTDPRLTVSDLERHYSIPAETADRVVTARDGSRAR
jgi:hypothetical protein